MKWTYIDAIYFDNGIVDRQKECDDLFTWTTDHKSVKVLKSIMIDTVYYGAIEVDENGYKTVKAAIVLTTGKDPHNPSFDFGYKAMIETCNPEYYDCPISILELLTPTTNSNAIEWRKKCLDNIE